MILKKIFEKYNKNFWGKRQCIAKCGWNIEGHCCNVSINKSKKCPHYNCRRFYITF